MSQFFPSGGQSIGASFSASVLSGLTPFRIDWLDLHTVQGTLKSLLHTTARKHQFSSTVFFVVQLLLDANNKEVIVVKFGRQVSFTRNFLTTLPLRYSQKRRGLVQGETPSRI